VHQPPISSSSRGFLQAPKFREVKDIPENQMVEVYDLIVDGVSSAIDASPRPCLVLTLRRLCFCAEGVFSPSLVYHEVDWFYNMVRRRWAFRHHRVLACATPPTA
jgi:hypothetical protein